MATTPVHVNIASDENEGRSVHLALPPAGSGPMISDEVRIPHSWRAGAGKHKITGTVFHRKRGVLQVGHDCGPFIADLAPPGPVGFINSNLPRMMPASSRKVMFGASTVRMEGAATGCSLPDRLPMLTCGEPVSLPTVHPISNTSNTVLVGMTHEDEVRGWEDMGDAMTVDAICFVVTVATSRLSELLSAPDWLDRLGWLGIDPVKSTGGLVVGLQRSIARSIASGGKEPIVVKLETGTAATGGVEVKVTPATGQVEINGEAVAGPGKASGGTKRDPEKGWSSHELPPDLFDG
jgi:hypothetical protein